MRDRLLLPALLAVVVSVLAAWAIAAVRPADATQTRTGGVEGTLTYQADRRRRWRYARYYVKDRKKGFLAEAVIALRSLDSGADSPKSKPPASRLYVIDQKDYRFNPETIAIRAGDRVKFTNADAVLHNVFSAAAVKRFDVNLRKGGENTQRFERAGGTQNPIRLRCVFHSSMQAWIFVFDHPFYRVTGENGRFRIANVPPGRYELVMVHPAGELRFAQRVEITAGKTLKLDIRVSPDNKVESKPQ